MSSLWINEQGSNHGTNVLDHLSFEHLDEDIYRSTGKLWIPWNSGRSIFGGQLIGLTINVSNSTISQNIFQLFSFNCQFLLPGNEKAQIYFYVKRIRDGQNYASRLVEVKQNDLCIFVLSSSYAKTILDLTIIPISIINEDYFTQLEKDFRACANGTQYLKGKVNDTKRILLYEEAPLNEERFDNILKEDLSISKEHKEGILTWIKERKESAIEIRDGLPNMYDKNGIERQGFEQIFWLKFKTQIPKDMSMQKALLSYMSDINLFGTVAKSIGIKTRLRALSSLQHSMQFFENDFDLMQPILFFIQSQLIIGERGTVIGRFYSQSGTLLASVLQEGLVRLSEDTNTTSSKL